MVAAINQDPTAGGFNGLKQAERTLESSWYIDPTHYQRELAAIWRRNWIYLCRADSLPAAPSFRSFMIGDQPIIVVRDRDDTLRAFFNTCRHRGSTLCPSAEGRLPTGHITCPYHAWSYKLDGSLAKIPSNRPEDADAADVNFAQGAFVMMGGMIAYSGLKALGLPLPVAAAVAIVAVAAVGVIIERVVVRPLWARKATMFVMILATLATQIVVERLALIVAGDQPRTLPPFTDLLPIRLGAIVISYQFLWIVGISLLLIVLLDQFLKRTKDRQGNARLRLQSRGGVVSGHGKIANAVAIICAVSGPWRHCRRPHHADAIHFVQRWRTVCDLRLHRRNRRRFRPPARRLHGRHHAGARASIAIVALGAGLKNVAALSVLLIFLFIRPGGILGEVK